MGFALHTLEDGLNKSHKKLETLYKQHPQLEEEQKKKAITSTLYAEYDAVESLSNQHLIDDSVSEKQKKEIVEKMEDEE